MIDSSANNTDQTRTPVPTLVANLTDGLIVVNSLDSITYINQQIERLFGYRPTELIGRSIEDVLPVVQGKSEVSDATGPLGTANFASRARKKDGTEFEVDVSWGVIEPGEKGSGIAIIRDLSEKRTAEYLLRASEARYRRLFEAAKDGILILDGNTGTVVDANQFIVDLTGISHENFLGKRLSELGIFEDSAEGESHFARLLKESYVRSEDVPLVRADATIVHVEFVSNVYLVDGHREIRCNIRDVTERKEAENALRESEERLRLAMEAARTAMFDWDVQSDQLAWSGAHDVLWGYSPHQFAGTFKSLAGRVHPDDLEGLITERNRCLAEKEEFQHEFRIVWDDSSVHWLHAHAKFFFGENGEPLRMRGVVYETTARKEAETLLQQLNEDLEQRVVSRTADLVAAKEDAEKANLAKSEFISRMSHELRTPLNAVLGYAQILDLSFDDPKITEATQLILKGGQHLLQMINEVLDLSRIESGVFAVSIKAVLVTEIVADAVAMVQPLADRSEIRIRIDVDGCDDLHVYADRQRLMQVLVNLLSNAIKYNHPHGEVVIKCETGENQASRITVSDTGFGIAPMDQDRLFQPFQRFGDHTVEGTGLGLTLSERFVRLMGGRLGLAASSPTGSTFFIELPRADAPDVKSSVSDIDLSAGSIENRRGTVLYIEDNLSNRRLLEMVFAEKPNIILASATNGEVGFELAKVQKPDLILLDLHLPDQMGDKVLKRLKADPETQAIPVAMISADATPRQIRALRAAGAVDYLTKPLDLKRLFVVLNEFLPEIP